MDKKITFEEHLKLGQELSNIHEKVFEIAPIIWKKSLKKSMLSSKIKNLIESLTALKGELEHEMYKNDGDKANADVYYPKVLTSNSHYEK